MSAASGPVARQPGDVVDQAAGLGVCWDGPLPAVLAAGVGGDAVADEGERGGEWDEPRVGAGLDGGAGDRGGEASLRRVQSPSAGLSAHSYPRIHRARSGLFTPVLAPSAAA